MLLILFIIASFSIISVEAQSSHPNLFVSAENNTFENHFFGSMVIEVIIRDNNISDTDSGIGEPDVTLNGNKLRMVQGSDGNWYAYFANLQKAKAADQIVPLAVASKSLDFGVFCAESTDASVLGASFSGTEGVAIPDDNGITGATQGTSSFTACTGVLGTPSNQNNVIRSSRSINLNPSVSPGQIGINPNAWPIVQLFSFNDNVVIIYNKGGGAQKVELVYSDIPNISFNLDRNSYPKGSEVFATINDMQLNQDPTSVDSWTFNVNSTRATFYQAFTESGSNSGNGGLGLVNLNPYLASLDFEKNGNVGLNLGSVVQLRTNQFQPTSSVTTGTTVYTKIVTFVETEPNSGIFESFDFNDESTIGISNNAPRGQSDSIEYNSKSKSIISGSFTASLSFVTQSGKFNPGQKATITLTDNDQNINPGTREHLDVFRSSAIIPTLQIGNPVTLEKTSSVIFYPQSSSFVGGTSFSATVPDKNSDRLVIPATASPDLSFEKITLDLGMTTNTLHNLFIDVPTQSGTNWINYDLRSFEQQLGITSFSDTKMVLYFGSLGSSPVQILGAGQISSGKGFVQISDSVIDSINVLPSSSSVFLEMDFDASNNNIGVGTISAETDTQPIVFDLFSFGERNDNQVNNAIYRAELEETSANSGTFTGTIEYAVTNQLNQFDPAFITSLRTIDDEIKFLINDELDDAQGTNLAYSDIANVGVTIGISSKTDIKTHAGTVTLESQTYRFGQPVVVVLTDPDLNLKHDVVDVYSVVNDPSSDADDTVGDTSGNTLLEIEIKGFRYHRCTINGIETGGLGSTGFTLVETGPATGIFKGAFKMPSQICNESRTKLISPAGGSIEVNYFDFRDDSGQPREIGLTFLKPSSKPQNQFVVEGEPAPNIDIKPVQMKDSFDRPILKPVIGQKINFVTEILNNDEKSQRYTYIIQVKDENNKVVDLRWVEGYADPAKKKTAGILWEVTSSGNYTVEIFLWDGIDSALPLDKKTEYQLNVGS
ncbi:MAG TPA: peptidase [Nitrosopumilaceae archaeon]|nr:peptidase [Nitrosopumilaceae archaeon]